MHEENKTSNMWHCSSSPERRESGGFFFKITRVLENKLFNLSHLYFLFFLRFYHSAVVSGIIVHHDRLFRAFEIVLLQQKWDISASLPAWTLIRMLSEPTNPQRTAISTDRHSVFTHTEQPQQQQQHQNTIYWLQQPWRWLENLTL